MRHTLIGMMLAAAVGVGGSSCTQDAANTDSTKEDWAAMRKAMVDQLRNYKIRDEQILATMTKVRRHIYIPETHRGSDAYGDHPSPIGHGQTISQPYIVAYMTEAMHIRPGEKILEIGTGSGYQAAILAELGADVYSIELVPELAEHARQVLKAEGYDKVKVLTGDGYKGWPAHAPFDCVIVTCAPDEVPGALVEQLRDGGRMILPVGSGFQRLVILRKAEGKVRQEDDIAVRFVPMVRGKDPPASATNAAAPSR